MRTCREFGLVASDADATCASTTVGQAVPSPRMEKEAETFLNVTRETSPRPMQNAIPHENSRDGDGTIDAKDKTFHTLRQWPAAVGTSSPSLYSP